jgi:NAD-dependent deacetylase
MYLDATVFQQAANRVRQATRVVVFTGAGMSAESGIPTFRDAEGLWRQFPPERFATLPGLLASAVAQPRRVAEFLVALLEPIASAQPNAGHLAVARLEAHKSVVVVTQNIDGLHQEAGSRTVYEVHGSMLRVVGRGRRLIRRLSRGELAAVVADLQAVVSGRGFAFRELLRAVAPIFSIGITGYYRPDVVLFGEAMAEPDWSQAIEAVRNSDCLIAVGTSATVMPAASLFDEVPQHAAVINIDPAGGPGELQLRGPAGAVLPALVEAACGP